MPAFAKMVADDRVGIVTLGFQRAIEKSLAQDADRDSPVGVVSVAPTQAEIRRRFSICAEGFEIMRGDLHWPYQRAIDELPRYLRAKLDGTSWEPDNRTIWTPG